MGNKELLYRQAQAKDLDALVNLTINSFHGQNGRSFYESVFDLTAEDYRQLVHNLFQENIPNNEYDLNAYFVLESNGELVSCLAGWKEGEDGIDSERILPMGVLAHVGVEKWAEKQDVIALAAELNLNREKEKIQIENMFLSREFRGTSAFFKIYYQTVDRLFEKYPECNVVQSRFFSSNKLAIRIAKHIGYEIVGENSFDLEPINRYFPNEGLVMTELKRSVFYHKNKSKSRLD